MKTRRWWSRGHPIVWLTEKQPSKVGTKETKKQRKSDVYHVTHACESKWHMQIVTIPKLSPYHVVNLVILGEGIDKESTLSISSFPSRYRHLFPITSLKVSTSRSPRMMVSEKDRIGWESPRGFNFTSRSGATNKTALNRRTPGERQTRCLAAETRLPLRITAHQPVKTTVASPGTRTHVPGVSSSSSPGVPSWKILEKVP